MNKQILIATGLFVLGQAGVWYQSNGQHFSQWAKDNPTWMTLLGLPVSFIFINASREIVQGFDGKLWPGRLIGFAVGMVIMTILTYIHKDEPVTTKTAVTLLLSFAIVFIQVFWK